MVSSTDCSAPCDTLAGSPTRSCTYNDPVLVGDLQGHAMRGRTLQRQILPLLAMLALSFLLIPKAAAEETPPAKPATSETTEAHLGKGYDALKVDRYEE